MVIEMERRAVLLALNTFQGELQGHHIQDGSDNSFAVAYINQGGGTEWNFVVPGSRNPELGRKQCAVPFGSSPEGGTESGGQLPHPEKAKRGRLEPQLRGHQNDHPEIGSPASRSVFFERKHEGSILFPRKGNCVPGWML